MVSLSFSAYEPTSPQAHDTPHPPKANLQTTRLTPTMPWPFRSKKSGDKNRYSQESHGQPPMYPQSKRDSAFLTSSRTHSDGMASSWNEYMAANGVDNAVDNEVLIIGLDFGTTQSGAAWTRYNKLSGEPEGTLYSAISSIGGWPSNHPGYGDQTRLKVPSVIAWDTSGNAHWGSGIPRELQEQAVRWFKLLLEPNANKYGERVYWMETEEFKQCESRLEAAQKKPIEAAGDFLRKFWEHIKKDIVSKIGEAIFEAAQKTVVITVPASWSQPARENTIKAAAMAGISEFDGITVHLAEESQAAALFVLKAEHIDRNLMPTDCFIVCDGGGGTVDLTTYEVEACIPLKLQEYIPGNGGLCGSLSLDHSFMKTLRACSSDINFNEIRPEHVEAMMIAFDINIKQTYSIAQNMPNRTWSFDIVGVPFPNTTMTGMKRIEFPSDALYAIFHNTCFEVLELFENQFKQLVEKNRTPKAIIMVGGFGSNIHLKERIKEQYPRMQILQSRHGLEAVAKGAVLYGIIKHQFPEEPVMPQCLRWNIGTLVAEPFDAGKHRIEDQYECKYTGKVMAQNQTRWMARLGERYGVGTQATMIEMVSFVNHADGNSSSATVPVDFYTNKDQNAPTHKTSSVHKFATIMAEIDTSQLRHMTKVRRTDGTGGYFSKVPTVVEMTIGPAGLIEFKASVEGKSFKTRVEYHELDESKPLGEGSRELVNNNSYHQH